MLPYVQERKKEAQAKLTFVRFTPNDVFVEFENHLFDIQIYDENQTRERLPGLPKITEETRRYMVSGTASTSAYSEIHSTVISFRNRDSVIVKSFQFGSVSITDIGSSA